MKPLAALVSRLRRLLVPDGSLASRTVRSGVWMTAINVGDKVLQLVMIVFLARLLGPGDFGLMGIALVAMNGLTRFTDLGITEALVQQEEENVDAYLDTAWVMQMIKGLLVGGTAFLAAPYIAGFFNEPRAADILRVVALSPVLLGVVNPAIVYFRKDLQFHKQFVYRMSGSVVRFGVALAFALAYGTVWALVFGYVAADLTRVVVSYVVHGYRPRPAFDVERAKELFGYGKWITVSSGVYFLITEGDDIVVGWLLTATSLGLYQLAYQLAIRPATEITKVTSNVMFPTYAKLQNDTAALKRSFLRTVQMVTVLSFPMAIGIIVIADPFVRSVLGEEWVPMILTLQLVSVYGLLFSLAATLGPVWNALGRPDIGVKIGVVRLAVIAVLIYPLTLRYGIAGTAVVVVIAYLFPTLPIDIYLGTKLIGATVREFLAELAYPLAASLSMGAVVWGVQQALPADEHLLTLLVSIHVGAAVYVLAVFALITWGHWGIDNNVRGIAKAFKG